MRTSKKALTSPQCPHSFGSSPLCLLDLSDIVHWLLGCDLWPLSVTSVSSVVPVMITLPASCLSLLGRRGHHTGLLCIWSTLTDAVKVKHIARFHELEVPTSCSLLAPPKTKQDRRFRRYTEQSLLHTIREVWMKINKSLINWWL